MAHGDLMLVAIWSPRSRRDVVDDAVAAAGGQAKRSDGKLPPHMVVYQLMALALFAGDGYEEVAARLTQTFSSWR